MAAWSTYIVVSSAPAVEETGATGREIESRQGGSYKKCWSKEGEGQRVSFSYSAGKDTSQTGQVVGSECVSLKDKKMF
jgi:hypothetical protein